MLTLLFLLQGLLHHCFVVLMGHVQDVLERNRLFSVELRNNSKNETMSIRFGEGGHLVDIELSSIRRDIPLVEGEMNLISHLQSAVGTGPQIKFLGVQCRYVKGFGSGCGSTSWHLIPFLSFAF